MALKVNKDEYIILEIVPTGITPESGQMVQLSAIKMKGFQVVSRFDYRLNEDKIELQKILDFINYDNELFNYKDTEEEIWEEFIKWSDNLPVLYIDNVYTLNFIKHLDNKLEPILKYLDIEYSDDVIEILVGKYNIQPNYYIVDILLEALIYHDNKKGE